MRRQATPEQIAKAKEKRARMREIARKISAMTDTERQALVSDWPTMITGHPVSMHNACMIAYQGGGTVLGGFWQWKEAGRKVRKGETGKCIWAPAGDKKGDNVEEIEVTDADGEKKKRRFVLVNVFDVSQTDDANAPAVPEHVGPSVIDVGRVNVLALAESAVAA